MLEFRRRVLSPRDIITFCTGDGCVPGNRVMNICLCSSVTICDCISLNEIYTTILAYYFSLSCSAAMVRRRFMFKFMFLFRLTAFSIFHSPRTRIHEYNVCGLTCVRVRRARNALIRIYRHLRIRRYTRWDIKKLLSRALFFIYYY